MSALPAEITVNPENQWRIATPGAEGWAYSARAGAGNKYFIVSVDSHLGPAPMLFRERIEKKHGDRLPRIEAKNGRGYLVLEGRRPMAPLEDNVEGEDLVRARAGSGASDVLLRGGAPWMKGSWIRPWTVWTEK